MWYVQAITVAIDKYAEKALGDRDNQGDQADCIFYPRQPPVAA